MNVNIAREPNIWMCHSKIPIPQFKSKHYWFLTSIRSQYIVNHLFVLMTGETINVSDKFEGGNGKLLMLQCQDQDQDGTH